MIRATDAGAFLPACSHREQGSVRAARAGGIDPNLFIAAIVACMALLCAIVASAHEIGKTQAHASLRGGRYQIDIVVDPDALLATLEAFGQRTVSRDLPREERDRRIAALAGVFLDRVGVSFDGRPAVSAFEYVPSSAFNDFAQTASTVRLHGATPSDAADFVFTDGLALGTYALNVRIGDGPAQTQWVVGGAPRAPVSIAAPLPPPTRAEIGRQYFLLGFTHILPNGFDHVLFVVGIFLLTSKWRSIVAQVSTFTIAHSITLALTMYGIVSLPAKVVEPMIALSIAYVAIENLVLSELKPWRLALVFSFGLLHGMGFAGVLGDLGLPRPAFLTALVTFNVGVEAGQLSVIAIAFALCAYWQHRDRLAYRRFIVVPASLAIALTGLFWTVQRALA
jgi:hydrogenase/urease accessory protein HupE